ncbi:MAG: hypothetical protein HY914_15865 [Desulfomonile tiedjei]|nr:hypothetical protein [Desulfomonile tiedjei]
MIPKETIPTRYPDDRSLDADLGAWWVMHIKPNCEKKMASYLMTRNVSYYFPTYTRKTRVGNLGRMRLAAVPVFKGYICFALSKEDHHLLYGTDKLVRIIKVEDQESFVKELSAVARAIASGEHLAIRGGLVPGKRVLILAGPLEGTEGVVVGKPQVRQLALSVEMFNQTVLVRLDPLTPVEVL